MRAKRVGISPTLMEMALRAERRDRPYVVEFESVEGESEFYRCTQEGPSKILYINTAHPFFSECYMVPGSTPSYRNGLEVLLWTLGLAELEASDEDRKRYVTERVYWSRRLAPALRQLAIINDHEGLRDYEASMAEDGEWTLPPAQPEGLDA